ncbi:hypothetical protein QBC45DRAFT_329965 [Copromyces sp. CBS 386.78]|nr:hypothetical protein QBC45DRAFT_329965 [Copromyces sp. CBS 386.78]
MKVPLSSVIVAIGLSSMATATPLNRAVKRQGDVQSSRTAEVRDIAFWSHNHSGPHSHKTTGTHETTDTGRATIQARDNAETGIMPVLTQTSSTKTDTGIMTIQTHALLTQPGPTLVDRDEDATSTPSPSSTTISDFHPREFTGFDMGHFNGIPKPSVTWSLTRSRTNTRHRPTSIYTSYAHINPPPRPTTSSRPVARDLGDGNESDTDDGDDFWDTATRDASQSHLDRRVTVASTTVVVNSFVTHTPEVTSTQYLHVTYSDTIQYHDQTNQPPKPTSTSSSPPPPPPKPTSTLTTRTITPPTIESKTPICPAAGTAGKNNIWCLGGQTFALACDTALDPSSNNFGSVTLSPQNWDMYGRCGALCAAVPDAKCTGFSYLWASGLCYLKEGEGAKAKDGGKKAEGTHSGRVVVLEEEEVGNCLGVQPRVGQYSGLRGEGGGKRRRDYFDDGDVEEVDWIRDEMNQPARRVGRDLELTSGSEGVRRRGLYKHIWGRDEDEVTEDMSEWNRIRLEYQ